MFKLRIVHKGLILVAIPLVFGTVFITLLFYGFTQSNRLVERELVLKEALTSYITFSARSLTAQRCTVAYNIGQSEFYKAHAKSNQEQATALYKHLKTLPKNEPSLVVPPLHLAAQWSGVGAPPGLDTGILRRQLDQLAKKQAKIALASMNLLQQMLWLAMFFSLVVTVVLAVFFCLNIRNRLLIIMNNTVSLSKGATPSPPLEGSDEIAELDQFLFKSATEIKELEKFKHQMIGVVSHELKSPLTSVGGFLSSLGEGVYGELPPKVKDKVGRTYNSVKRLMGLVKELLYLDRLELQMDPELIPVDEIIAASIDTVKELSEQYGIEIVVIKNNVQTVYADRNRLVQVIVNLLSNAMKFSPPQGKVTIETKQGDGIFECCVRDQGRGIPEDFRKQIFEPFKQVDSKDATTKKGTGLGLTISRSIVEQHGGTIGVDSVLGEGSTFWLRIPDSAKFSSKTGQDSARHNLPSLKSPESKESSQSKTWKWKKFSVLQQGLVIIAVPLIFQLVFVSVIANMLIQVGEQTKREQNAQDLVNSITRMAEGLLDSTQVTVMYSLTRDSRFKQALDMSWNGTLDGLDRSKRSISDVEELKIIEDCKRSLKQMRDVVERESSKAETNGGFQKLIETGGWNLLMSSMIKGVGNDNQPGSAAEPMQIKTPTGEIIGQEMLAQMKKRFKECLVIGEPGLDALSALDRLMLRENAIGKSLSIERSKMIENLKLTLAAGVVLNLVLSIFLAITLMRSLTTRLQHVMENTARMVKREELDLPIKGGDEIAYLDQILFETANRLMELESFKQQLISIVSHELRTPLLSVSVALEMFGTGTWGELSEKGKLRLKFAQEEASRLIRLINDLLDIEKMEAGKFVLDKTEINIADLIEASTTAVAQLAEVKQIKLESSVSETTLLADRDRLCQVLINLLSNAIKYSPDGGTINVKVASKDSQLEFCVSDHGRGIPDELRQKIFDRFVQVEKADETERGGSGLGLAISKAIVEQHGGSIGVQSKLGEGSTFWFRIPAEKQLQFHA